MSTAPLSAEPSSAEPLPDACSPSVSRSVRSLFLSSAVLSPHGALSLLSESLSEPALPADLRPLAESLVERLEGYFQRSFPSPSEVPAELSYPSLLSDLFSLSSSLSASLSPDNPPSPPSCPLLPSSDLTLASELSKLPYGPSLLSPSDPPPSQKRLHLLLYTAAASSPIPPAPAASGRGGGGTGWSCLLCGKRFKTPYYLDRHLRLKHPPAPPAGAVCVADVCPALGCDDASSVAAGHHDPGYGPGDGRGAARLPPAERCDDAAMGELRGRCGALLGACLGGLEVLGAGFLAALTAGVCEKLTCATKLHELAGREAVARGGGRSTWEEEAGYEVPFWRGKVALVVLAVFYVAVAVWGGGRGRGRELRRRSSVVGGVMAMLGGGGGGRLKQAATPEKKKLF